MEHSPYWDVNSQLSINSLRFMEFSLPFSQETATGSNTELESFGSLPCLQEPATGQYSGSDVSSSELSTLFP
jgi:hypothetical protein